MKKVTLKDLGYELVEKDGKYYYNGDLNLYNTKITTLPDNLVVGGSLNIMVTKITSLPDNLVVGGSLFIKKTDITLLPNNLVVGGNLDLYGTKIAFLPDNLTIGGSFILYETKITSLPDNLTVGGLLDLEGTNITSLPDNLVVGGGLNLYNTKIATLPDSLIVGGYLNLNGTKITSLPDNLVVVGGDLDIRGTKITSLPNDLIVGGSLFLYRTKVSTLPDNLIVGDSIYFDDSKITEEDINKVNYNVPSMLSWRNKEYVKVDGIFTKVISNKGNVYRVSKIGRDKVFYLVTDGDGKWSHGETLEEAKEDLIYKIFNRDKSRYENLTLDSELTFEEAIEAYRVITGACSFGAKDFVVNRLSDKKDKYKIKEIIQLTEGEYKNNVFKEYFTTEH